MASGVGPGEHGEKSGIWIINVLAATPRQIRGNAEGAVPSPDGSMIAFRSSNSPDLGVVDVSGENYRKIATASLNENFGQLQWSPDGKKLGVLVRRLGDPEGSIETFDINSGARAELGRVPRPRSFVWLGDGRLIVSSVEADGSTSPVLHEIGASGRKTEITIGPGNTVAQISATTDGKRLVLVRQNSQSDAYVAPLAADGKGGEARRITLDDRDDFPSAWLRDSRTILFSSRRNGSLDVFRQAIDSPVAEQLAAGPEEQFGAEPVAEGDALLYWSAGDTRGSMRLMRMPSAGGPAEQVLEAPANSTFHCAARAPLCVLATPQGGSVELSSFDWKRGTRQGGGTTVAVTSMPPLWAIAADGSSVAFADASGLRVVTLGSGATTTVAASDFPGQLAGVAPGREASSWLVTANAARGNQLLLVSGGRVRALWTSERPLALPSVSPDGKHLLVGITSTNSNAWLIENF